MKECFLTPNVYLKQTIGLWATELQVYLITSVFMMTTLSLLPICFQAHLC